MLHFYQVVQRCLTEKSGNEMKCFEVKIWMCHHHHHLYSFRRSVQDYKIQMDMEIITFEGKQGVKPLQSVHLKF